MSNELTPSQVLEAMTEAYSRGDLDAGMALIDDTAIDHSAPGGPSNDLAAWRRRWENSREAVPDLRVSVEQVVSEGDWVARRLRTRGHDASGAAVEMLGIDMVRVRDGRLVEHWAFAQPVR